MCYDLSFSTSIELVTKYLPNVNLEIAKQIDLQFEPRAHFQGHIYPKLPVLVLENGSLVFKPMEWGVVAPYMNTPEKIKKNRPWMLNARSEKVIGDKKSVWYRMRKSRCIIAANGFFEHRAVEGMKQKIPYFVHRMDQPVVFLAGLFTESVVPETGEVVLTFTIITREANSLMRTIHNDGDNAFRMPLQIENDTVIDWLKPDASDEEIQSVLDFEFPPQQMEAWPVYSVRGRSGRPDGKQQNEPFDYPGLPTLDQQAKMNPQATLF